MNESPRAIPFDLLWNRVSESAIGGRGIFSRRRCLEWIITPRGEKLQSPKAPGLKDKKIRRRERKREKKRERKRERVESYSDRGLYHSFGIADPRVHEREWCACLARATISNTVEPIAGFGEKERDGN